MRLVALAATACTLAAAGAVPATAAAAKPKPKPIPKVCNLIVDDADDANSQGTIPASDASVDIVGGDVASNAKTITAVLRIKALTNPNPQSPAGQAYYVLFNVKGLADTLTLSAGLYPTGNQFSYGYQGVDPNTGVNTSYTLGDAAGKITGNEIRISVDIAKFPQAKSLKAGTKLTTLTADARHVYGQRVVASQQVGPARAPLGGVTLTFDDAIGKTYTLAAPSCVKVG
jgi:hypothetical protein